MALTELTKVTGPGIHTLSNILSHNIKSSGIITATKFSGPLDSIGGNFAGVITATNGVFSGNVTIGGTLTYEDVTNIDSVGIITARNGIDCNGDLDVDGHTELDNGNVSGVVTFTSAPNAIQMNDNARVSFGTSLKTAITYNSSDSKTKIVNFNDTLQIGYRNTEIYHTNQARLTFDSGNTFSNVVNTSFSGANYNVVWIPSSDTFRFNDNAKLVLGTNGDTEMYHNNSHLLISNTTGNINVTGNVVLNNDISVDGHTNLDNVSIAGVTTTSGLLDINAGGQANTFKVEDLTDNRIVIAGTGGELEDSANLTFDGSLLTTAGNGKFSKTGNCNVLIGSTNAGGAAIVLDGDSDGNGSGADYAYIEHDTSGNLNIVATNPADNSQMVFNTGDGGERLRITAVGQVQINTDGGSGALTLGASQDFKMYHDAGGPTIFTDVGNQGFKLQIKELNLTEYTGTTNRLKIDTSGHILPGASGTQNLGSTSLEWGNVYIADSKNIFFGSDQDGEIYHSGSHLYLQNGTGNLYIRGGGQSLILRGDNNKDGIIVNATTTFLYYDNAVKLTTSGTGIEVTGEVAASQDYPNYKPRLNFNFTASKKLDPIFTYQRTGPASFTDEFGKVVLVGSNTPRFDHDPMTGECKGLMFEISRTNYVRQSLTLADEWVAGSGDFAIDNTITNPDGSVGAYYHTGTELYHENIDLSGASTNVITVSLWVKERSGQSGNLDIEIFQQISGGAISMGVWSFNPTTEVISTAPSTYSDGRVQEYPNGWYRVSAKATTASGNFSSTTRFDMQSSEHYVWGMQIEAGSFPTSFIPTNGATATRGHENVVIDGDDFTDFYNPKESTAVCEFDTSNWITYNANAYERIFSFGNLNTETDTFEVFKQNNSNSGARYRVRTGNSNVLGAANYSYGTNTTPKVAFAVKLNDAALSIDGGTPGGTSDTGIPMPTVTQLSLGNSGLQNNNGVHMLNGYIRKFMYYPVKLSDSQVVTLTS